MDDASRKNRATPKDERLARLIEDIAPRVAHAIDELGLTIRQASQRMGWKEKALRDLLTGNCRQSDIWPVLNGCRRLGMTVKIEIHASEARRGVIAVVASE